MATHLVFGLPATLSLFALSLLADPHRLYIEAPEGINLMLVQAVCEKIWILDTGVVGLEALSRGASQAIFVERDFRLAQDIDSRLRTFALVKQSRLYRTDAYRWVAAYSGDTNNEAMAGACNDDNESVKVGLDPSASGSSGTGGSATDSSSKLPVTGARIALAAGWGVGLVIGGLFFLRAARKPRTR